ncbi:hypothetical protein ACWGMA_24990 [Streptomyces asiaticus]
MDHLLVFGGTGRLVKAMPFDFELDTNIFLETEEPEEEKTAE